MLSRLINIAEEHGFKADLKEGYIVVHIPCYHPETKTLSYESVIVSSLIELRDALGY